eukprot:760648-Hanusia_phi.AAC.2
MESRREEEEDRREGEKEEGTKALKWVLLVAPREGWGEAGNGGGSHAGCHWLTTCSGLYWLWRECSSWPCDPSRLECGQDATAKGLQRRLPLRPQVGQQLCILALPQVSGRLGVPRYQEEDMQMDQAMGAPSAEAVDRGLHGLCMEDSLAARTLSAIFESTVLDFDMYLDQDLEWFASEGTDYQECITCSGAFSGMCENDEKVNKEETTGRVDNKDRAKRKREAELALEVIV